MVSGCALVRCGMSGGRYLSGEEGEGERRRWRAAEFTGLERAIGVAHESSRIVTNLGVGRSCCVGREDPRIARIETLEKVKREDGKGKVKVRGQRLR